MYSIKYRPIVMPENSWCGMANVGRNEVPLSGLGLSLLKSDAKTKQTKENSTYLVNSFCDSSHFAYLIHWLIAKRFFLMAFSNSCLFRRRYSSSSALSTIV